MKKNLFNLIGFGLLFLCIFSGCKKNLDDRFVETTTIGKNTLMPYAFDWEVGDHMPTPSGITILMPWASGSNQSFPLIYATDIKKADGWELVYNTFSPTEFVQPAYFVLYNRYRGILRGYFYLTPGTPIPSSYISHTLMQRTAGADAPLLSYSGGSAADLSVVTNDINLTQQYKTTATGTWYAAEFEMVYDPTVGSKDANNNTMTWQINSINASDLAIEGTSQGGIHGTIAQPKPPGPSIFGSIISGALNFVGFKALSTIVLNATTPSLKNDVVNGLKKAATAGLTGAAVNVANGIFGGASTGGDSTKQYVNLTTNTKYQLTGTSTDIYSLVNPSMVIPGSNGQTSVVGYAPAYTKPLGVMTLSSAPTAKWIYHDQNAYPSYPVRSYFEMRLNVNSYNIVWNPYIINSNSDGASVQNVRREIICYENYLSDLGDVTDGVWPATLTEFDGFNRYLKTDLSTTDEIKIKSYAPCPSCDNFDLIPVDTFTEGQKLPKHVLRITFDVVPNNGAPRVTISKSFNIILQGPLETVYL